MHKPIWDDRITLDKKKNEIVRIINARSNQKIIPGLKKGEQTNFDCYKEYETSTDVCRNLYRNFYNYLGVEFPKEIVWNYRTKRHVRRGYDEWDEVCCGVHIEKPEIQVLTICHCLNTVVCVTRINKEFAVMPVGSAVMKLGKAKGS